MKKCHSVTDLHFDGDVMILTIDSHERKFRVTEISPVLQKASRHERDTFEISP